MGVCTFKNQLMVGGCVFSLLLAPAMAQTLEATVSEQESEPIAAEVSSTVLRASLSKTEAASLSLREALEIALAENQTRLVAGAEVKEAKAKYQNRLSQFLPDFTISQPFTNYEGFTHPTNALPPVKLTRSSYQPQLVFRFTLLPKGAQFLQAGIAKRELASQRENEQAVTQQILRQTALSYYEFQRRLQEVSIAQHFIEETEAALALNKERLATGSGTQLDVLQSETQAMEAQKQYVEAVEASEAAALRLNELLNLSAFVGVSPDSSQPKMQMLVPTEADFKEKLLLAMQTNPGLKAIEKKIESLTHLFKPVSLALAMMPEVSLQYRTGKVGAEEHEMARFDERTATVAMTFQNMGFNSWTQYKGFRAQIEKLHFQLEAEKNALERQLSEAWVKAKARQAQVAIAQKKLALSQETLKNALEQLRQGQGRNLDVVTAETSLNQARQDLNTTIFEYNQAQVNLVHGLGLASVDSLTTGIPVRYIGTAEE